MTLIAMDMDENEISGCQDELACNYNSNATDDDGSCYNAQEFYIVIMLV